ncbi:MAG TPA: hypothetical protein VKU19_21395 [Bryobacteraceae bacterium]|nr:hypothetical protein [Bryobacteraceae bacterium]
MESRKASQSIRKLVRRYQFMGWAWRWLPALAPFAVLFGFALWIDTHTHLAQRFPALGSLPGGAAFWLFRQSKHGRRFERAVTELQSAIQQYEAGGLTDSTLHEAAERVRHALSLRPPRTARSSIQIRMRICGIAEFALWSVFGLPLFLLRGWEHSLPRLLLGVLLWQVIVGVPIDGLKTARRIYFEAIERYEGAPEEDERILDEACVKASGYLRLASLFRKHPVPANPAIPSPEH